MPPSLRVLVTGLIAQHPLLGGIAWHYLQYVLGLARLGHDAYYLEDSGEWPYELDAGAERTNWVAQDCSANVAYLGRLMGEFDLGERWLYRCPIDGTWYGLSDRRRREVLRTTDVLVNVSGTLARPDEYGTVSTLIYVDTDPVFTQIRLAQSDNRLRAAVDVHDVHFTFGESLDPDLAATGHTWHPTRQPVVLSEWDPGAPHGDVFTTVMNWASYDPVEHDGHSYGQKDVEFGRFLDLPGLVAPTELEVGVRGTNRGRLPGHEGPRTPEDLPATLRTHGWRVVNTLDVCPDFAHYRDYVQGSAAEWSVAKNAYVAARSGWFSDRSACYLAAGRPVVVQDTGLPADVPTGEGIVVFSNLEEATAAVRDVRERYDLHAAAARELAEECFESGRALNHLLEVGLTTTSTAATSPA